MIFDYVKERSLLDVYRSNLYQYKDLLNEGRRVNQERERLVVKLEKAISASDKLRIIMQAYKKLEELVLAEDINFKNRRLDFISEAITSNLNVFFPHDGFKAKLVCDFNRGMKVRLDLYDSNNRLRRVHISEGKLLQSQVSYSAAIAIAFSLGVDKLYLDEAFAASSPNNLTKTEEVTKWAIDNGMQIIMIEQYPNGYKDLKRREFWLKKNPITMAVEKPVVMDY
jgi:hypothetical protein